MVGGNVETSQRLVNTLLKALKLSKKLQKVLLTLFGGEVVHGSLNEL